MQTKIDASATPNITPRYLRTNDAAIYVGAAKSTLEKLRLFGGGPVFSKLGRTVVYDLADLDAWVSSNRRRSTCDNGSVG